MEEKQININKPILNLVVIGNVDSGKSTTCGHLLYKLGGVDKRQMESLQKEAEIRKKQSFALAYVMDQTNDSRSRGITIDISMKQFQTQNFNYTLIDAPGHQNFVKNMITGTQQADLAMLMVSAHKGEFESGFSKDGQTKEHALLAFTLGVKKMIVCVNKMDQESVKFSKERYEEVKSEVEAFLTTKIGYKSVTTVPISGFNGDNLTTPSENMPWYKGPTLLQILDSQAPPQRPFDKPLRIPIQSALQIQGIGTVATGKVESGTLKPNTQLMLVPSGKICKVQSIEAHRVALEQAGPGDTVGINLRNITVKEIEKGMVLCEVNTSNKPAKQVKEFVAQVMIINHPKGIKAGYTPVISCHSSQFACAFKEIITQLDKKTGKPMEGELPSIFKNGSAIMVKMVPQKPVVLELFSEFPSLGRFVVRDMKKTVAIGIVKEIIQ